MREGDLDTSSFRKIVSLSVIFSFPEETSDPDRVCHSLPLAKNLYILNELLPALVHYQVPSSSNSSVPILKSKTSVVPPPSGIPNPLYIASRPLGAEYVLLLS
jgi:hypothetical protein